MTLDLQSLAQSGVAALKRGDAAAARHAFDRIEAQGRGTHQLRLYLAQACMFLGDHPAAHSALDKVLSEEPSNLYAILMRGDLVLANGDERAAMSWYRAALTHAGRSGPLPPDLVARLNKANEVVGRTARSFKTYIASELAANGIDTAVLLRFKEAMKLMAGDAEIQLQRPTSFYYPQLASRPFFERQEFDWVDGLETAAPDILDELRASLANDDGLEPYVQPEPHRPVKHHALLQDPRWSAFHLIRSGVKVDANAQCCPKTMAALAKVTLPKISGQAPMALFSVLRPRTHIPPHNGLINTRLIVHLPLIVPCDCRLRVGNETRDVEIGRTMIFDDSIEHEAWNDSDETRVVLLFEIWRPDLTSEERSALTTLFQAVQIYGENS